MLNNIKSSKIIKDIFSLIIKKSTLKIVCYNKALQTKLTIDINLYKEVSDKIREFSKDVSFKEYDKRSNELIFEGKLLDGKISGLCKEYKNGSLIFEGEYKNGKKNGSGKAYRNNEIIFEGIYLNGKEWEGKGEIIEQDKNEDQLDIYYYIGEISKGKKHGKGKVKDQYGAILYEGDYLEGKKHGKGKELFNSKSLIYEGEFSDDKRNGQGKEYENRTNFVLFEGQYLNGERWEGILKEYYTPLYCLKFEGEFKKGKKNGKAKEYYNVPFEHCQGKIKFNTKIKFKGNYLDGEKEGKGIEYHKNEKIKFQGI